MAVYNHYKRIYHNIPVNKRDNSDPIAAAQLSHVQQGQYGPPGAGGGHLPSHRDLLHIAGRGSELGVGFPPPNNAPPSPPQSPAGPPGAGGPLIPPHRADLEPENLARIVREHEERLQQQQQQQNQQQQQQKMGSNPVGSDVLESKKHDLR